jgi:AcrR family transcriptional regulator
MKKPRKKPRPEVELLWNERAPATRGPKPALTREGIVAAAIAIADAEGLAAVSMPRIAEQFEVTTMALYRHVPGKAELVALMVDAGLAPPPHSGASTAKTWRKHTEAWAEALLGLFRRHPWALEATGRMRVMGPNELSWLESGLAALAGSGLEGADRVDAFLAVNGQVRSWAQFAVEMPDARGVSQAEWSGAVETLLESHGERYPELARAMRAGAFAPGKGGFGLARVLDGIAAYARRR